MMQHVGGGFPYVQQGLDVWFDGLLSEHTNDGWVDIIHGITFSNAGAVYDNNGFIIGTNKYLTSTDTYFRSIKSDGRSIEVVFEDYGGNTSTYAFILSANKNDGGICMAYSSWGYLYSSSSLGDSYLGPTLRNTYTSIGKKCVSINKNSAYINLSKYTDIINSSAETGGTVATIGCRYRSSVYSFPFNGKIYCIRIYDRTLSDEEILYNQGIDNERFNLGL